MRLQVKRVNSGMYVNWSQSRRNWTTVRFGSQPAAEYTTRPAAAFGQKQPLDYPQLHLLVRYALGIADVVNASRSHERLSPVRI
jgi:hypothetical protein